MGGCGMSKRTKVCFVATNQSSCEQIGKQLETLLGQFIEVSTWRVREPLRPELLDNDIFIAGNYAIFEHISVLIPAQKKVMMANRTLGTSNLDAVLALPEGTEALMVGNWEEAAYEKIELLKHFAIDKLKLYPYWLGNTSYPKHVKVAITTGQHTVPPGIEKVIDIGARIMDLSTIVELIVELNLPREVINDISNHYISEIVTIASRRLKVAEQSERLKNRLEVILGTVDQGIIEIDEDGKVALLNPTAEKMLERSSRDIIGKFGEEIIPEIGNVMATNSDLIDVIGKIGNSHYVINTTPILDAMNRRSGIVISLKATAGVQELDSKVRRELKRKGNVAKHSFGEIVGVSEEIIHAISMAKKFSDTDLTILLEGESGTGKELFGQSIHNASARKNAPFIAVNFAALPESLMESELFGYEDGAFTGARKGGKAGYFEEAHTGTIFLDEIGDASLEVQKRLLRVLEEKEVRRVGGSTVTPIDIRVVAATNQNLRQLVEEGKFRQDLYFRLCTIQIAVPALKKRKKDIPVLIDYFANKLYRRELRSDNQILDYLTNYDWPGNIRELQNVVKFLCGMVGPNETAMMRHLPAYLLEKTSACNSPATKATPTKAVEAVIAEFSRLGALDPLFWVLSELKQAEMFARPIGRLAIVQALAGRPVPCPEYKVRLWLKRLEQGGCLISGVTKQGSRLTELGNEVLSFLEDHAGVERNGRIDLSIVESQ
jgi:transcriptional regulator with PAS, ATPase and Fis domain